MPHNTLMPLNYNPLSDGDPVPEVTPQNVARLMDRNRQLTRALKRLESILTNVSDGVILLDLQEGIQQANLRLYQLLDMPLDACFGEPLESLFVPDAHEKINDLLRQTLITNQTQSTETALLCRDGTSLDVELMISPTLPLKDDNVHVICTLRDITERKASEAALRASEMRLRLLFEAVPDAIIVTDNQDAIIDHNHSAIQMTGFSHDELIGKHYLYLFDKVKPRNIGINELYERINHAEDGTTFDLVLDKPDGTVSYMEVRMYSLEGETQDYNLTVAHDVTHRRQIELDLLQMLELEREQSQMRSRFITMTSHEFRTPLATIQAASETLRDFIDRMDQTQREKRFRKIEEQIAHMTLMLDDVLTLGKFSARDSQLILDEFDVDQFISEIMEASAQIYDTHRLIYSSDHLSIQVKTSQKLLRQIVTNLLSNATKYSPEGSIITLTLTHNTNEFMVKVSDQGIGIDESDICYVFEMFHRGKNIGKRPGTGLGLAICKHAVDALQGNIHVKSVLGEGSTFIVTLPMTIQ